MAEAFDPFASGQATEIQASPEASFDPFASGQAVAVSDSDQPPAQPTSSATGDFFQRLGENLWRSLGGLEAGLDSQSNRFGLGQETEASYLKKMAQAGNSPRESTLAELRRRDQSRIDNPSGDFLKGIADSGSRRTDPARDSGLAAMTADIIGGIAPAFLLGPLAPVGMGAMLSDQEKQRALTEGQSQDEAQARGDIGFSVGTAAGLLPVFGKSIATKALTGAAGNALGDVAIEAAQGRTPEGKSLARSAGIGALFGTATGVQQKVAARRAMPEPAKGPSIVTQMDGATHGTPAEANVAANEIALQPIEPTRPPNASPTSTSTMDVTVGGKKLNQDEINALVPAATLDEVVPGAKVKAEPEAGPAVKELLSRSGGEESLKSIKDAIDSDKGYVQITVWPEEYSKPGGPRMDTFDAIDPDNPKPGGNGSTNRALLNELGIEIPEIPKDFPHGQYTLDQFKELVKKPEKAAEAPKVDEPVADAKTYLDELLATKEITPEEHAKQLAELTQQKDAVQIRIPEEVPVREQAQAGQEVGSQIRNEAQAQEEIANKQSAKVVEAPLAEPLISPPELQKVADDIEVSRIVNNDGVTPPPEPPKLTASGDDPGYRPGLTKFGLGIGKVAEFAKVAAGTIEGNIRDASKRIFGTLRNYEYAKSRLSLDLESRTMPASRLSRKILTTKGNDLVGNLLMSGKIDEAKALVDSNTRHGAEFAKTIDDARAALDYVHQLQVEARGAENAPYQPGYFPRQLISYDELMKFFGKDERAVADAALKRAQDRSETPLTKEQTDAALNDLVTQSRMNGGKPGFLKSRTIKTIDENISKFYEPWDVALENYLRRATNDIVNRSYFGKAADGAAWNPSGGSFGKVIAEEIAAGRLKGKAQNIVIDNLRDRFTSEYEANGISDAIGRKIRFAQSAAFLGQTSTAVAQFGDVYGSTLHQGPIDTIKGYTNRRFNLKDIGIHEGNVETAQFSRRKGLVDKAANLTIKFGVGLSDQFNKGGVANAIQRHYADVVKKPDSAAFARLNAEYSRKFPEQWPAMLKELQSKQFQQGNVKGLPEAQFFLYNEIADIHPINPSGMAQGFNAAHPLAKPLWGLKSYMIKQLDIMRARGYEKIKNPSSRGEGLAYLASYAAIVAGAQNFSISWIRDKLADRETDTSDYFVGGFLQPLGISRYTLNTLRKGEVGKALTETLLPIASLGREAINDASLVRDLVGERRDKTTRRRTVKDFDSLVQQSELVKHFPVLGSLYYSNAGKGAANEKKRRAEKKAGRGQLNTVETISDIISPEETSAR